MPVTDIIILALVVIAFVAFAVVLAWGDLQTAEIARASRARALGYADRPEASPRQEAAAESAHKPAEQMKSPAHA